MLSLCPIEQIKIGKDREVTDESVLHLALCHGAPLRSVELLTLKYPLCLTMPNLTRMYACHVVCKRLARHAEILCVRERLCHRPPGPGGQGSDTLHRGVLRKLSQISSSPAVRKNMTKSSTFYSRRLHILSTWRMPTGATWSKMQAQTMQTLW